MVNEGHACTACFFADDVARLTFGTHKQYGTFIGNQTTHYVLSILKQGQGFFQIDDVDFVAGAENVLFHFRVPVTGLVTKVNACFQHLAHSNL